MGLLTFYSFSLSVTVTVKSTILFLFNELMFLWDYFTKGVQLLVFIRMMLLCSFYDRVWYVRGLYGTFTFNVYKNFYDYFFRDPS